MSAQPVPTDPLPWQLVPPPWQPDPARQKVADYTLEDVLDLPGDAPRVELVDGRMLPLPSPRADHQEVASLTWLWLRRHAPRDRWRAIQAVGIAVIPQHSFEPDVLLVDAGADLGRHFFSPSQVTLVVEIVSPGTKRRDRIEKPAEYAAARIPHFWRIETEPVHVYAYRLGPAGHYDLVADGAEQVELTEPFPVTLPVAEITP